jgi:tRNA(Ile)-lysidine synthase TilS/MesJ
MRILRGAGLYGLSGILPKRKLSGFEIIRPLIEVKRREIEAYLKRKGIKPRLDTTNLEEIYFRNRIRNKLLPLLEKEYKQIFHFMGWSALIVTSRNANGRRRPYAKVGRSLQVSWPPSPIT